MSTAIPVPQRPRRSLRSLEAAFFGRLRREPPQTKLGRLAFWLLVIGAAASAGHLLPGTAGDLFFVLAVLALTALSFVLFALLWRWVVGRFLWKVRNRLIVTYLLMGLAPIVLFATLAFLAAYVLAGQFAIYISLEQVTRGEAQMGSHNRAMTGHMAHVTSFPLGPTDPSDRPAQGTEEGDGPTTVRVFRDGRLVQRLEPPGKKLPNDPALDHIPAWVSVPFRGLVLDGGRLYLRAIDSEEVGGHTTAVVSSAPVERRGVDQVAQGLGQITIVPDVSGNVGADLHEDDTDADADSGKATEAASKGKVLPAPVVTPSERRERAEALTTRSISGGKLPPAAAFYDLPVSFYAPLPTVDWETGKSRDGITHVTSRPSLLYQHLFSRSLQIAAIVLERLLEEQREKERLQGELAIAQEVQANLFPSMRISLPMLEVHGVCHPARSVSGDYYDFLLSGASDLSIALGDISGKGISAALLMATLHSAVRAYRFAGEDMTAASSLDPSHGLLSEGGVVATVASAPGISFAEPARIMGLLNRHLFRSTQPEKYATLFLAHYDGVRRTLTYSTGGQLPPLLLRADNTVARLDCGGTVVGLIDRMRYEQGEETMQPGDILIAYSDGVTEPENDFGDFGEDRLLEIVSRHRHLPLDGICEQVMQALRSWIGTAEQPDDITLVLARQR
jgi:sigma-B regulation protein RsbU (phosphoserine phosphatase)